MNWLTQYTYPISPAVRNYCDWVQPPRYPGALANVVTQYFLEGSVIPEGGSLPRVYLPKCKTKQPKKPDDFINHKILVKS
jgi:hypothetical protein